MKKNSILWDKFIVLEKYYNEGHGAFYIVYDKDTKVEYYFFYGLCPIYNADGTVRIYEGE
jgi:hypothetical protein